MLHAQVYPVAQLNMNKKASSLSLETIIIAIIVLVVIIMVAYFVLKQGGLLATIIGDQANNSVALIPENPLP